MSGLLAALHRLDGRSPRPATRDVEPEPSVDRPPPPAVAGHVEAAAPPSVTVEPPPPDEWTAIVEALVHAAVPPGVVAFVSIGVDEPFAPMLRELAERVARRFERDVLLVGPGGLESPAVSAAHASDALRCGGYAFLHASAEYAAGRLDALSAVSAVVPVVEFGRTTPRAVAAFRELLTSRGVPMLGSIVLGAD